MASGKKVLILGGGFGGARAAIAARALLGPEHDVTLVDRNRRTYICGAMPLLIVGEREAANASRSLGTLANRGVQFIETQVTRIDLAGQTVRTGAGSMAYDYLVVALGAEYDWAAVPGSKDAHSFYNIETARRLRRRLSRFRPSGRQGRGRVVIAVASTPYKCPPAPYEAAMIMRWHFKRAGTSKDVDIDVFTPEDAPLPVAGQAACDALALAMQERGITFHPKAGVKEVSPDGRTAQFTDGSSMDADIVVTIPTHRPALVVREAGFTAGKPWVPVNPANLETSTTGVFAIGDVNMVPMATGRPIPKAGVFASAEGELVARTIAARITGAASPPAFPGEGQCFLAYSGTQSAFVSGRFLTPGKPEVTLTLPSRSGMRAKERFERDWRRFRI